jgi:hypothetical protein
MQPRERRLDATLLIVDHPQLDQRAAVARIGGNHLAVERGSFGEPPRQVMLGRLIDRLVDPRRVAIGHTEAPSPPSLFAVCATARSSDSAEAPFAVPYEK